MSAILSVMGNGTPPRPPSSPAAQPVADVERDVAGSRVRELRKRAGLTQRELGERVGLSHTAVSKIENGERGVKEYRLRRLAAELECEPADLLAAIPGVTSIPLLYEIGLAQSEALTASELPPPVRRIPPPFGMAAEGDLFAAYVVDDSADRMGYPAGSTLIARQLALPTQLPRESKVIVRRYITDRRDGRTLEVLVGKLDTGPDGMIVLHLRSADRGVPPSVVIQEPPDRDGLADIGGLKLESRPRTMIDYLPRDDDPAEIIGIVAFLGGRRE